MVAEYSEDIYPYATFQLEESVPPGGDSRCNSAAPLQTFVYHDPRLSTADTLQLRETSCTMDQNLARLQNPHRFLRENRFLEGEDPRCYSWRVIPARRPVPTSAQSPGLAIPSTSRAIPAPIGTRSVTDQGICSSPSWTHPRASPTRLS